MVAGTIVLVLWKELGLGDKMYEIVPGIIVNCLTISVINIFMPQQNEQIMTDFEQVANEAKAHLKKKAALT
jgi:sodium/proline symporter